MLCLHALSFWHPWTLSTSLDLLEREVNSAPLSDGWVVYRGIEHRCPIAVGPG
jgi:hypothetical protein